MDTKSMKWSTLIGRFAGIDVYVHVTFLILLGWFAWIYWVQTGTIAGVLTGLTLILLLFACVLLHEYGHALTARRYGIETRNITLLPIGGLALLERMPTEPRQEIVVALAGPAVNVVIAIVIYLILVPLLVYFMIKDKRRILDWLSGFLPDDRQLTGAVWLEVNKQISNYVRGKFAEILIVGFVTVVTFKFIGLQYALLLGALTGLSVLIPYIGAAAITLPVALVAFAQWGFNSDFYAAVIAYLIIQALDGNLLAPLLFSEAVNLHPVAIIVAILFFGGVWGFWGLFFAIPLATVIQAVIQAWPGESAIAASLPDSPTA